MQDMMEAELPSVTCREARGEHRISVSGVWFPRRDDVQGVVRLRAHFRNAVPASFRDSENVYLDIYVRGDIDLDRAVTGCCTALDGQHGTVDAALWDDSMIRQVKVARIGGVQRHQRLAGANDTESKDGK